MGERHAHATSHCDLFRTTNQRAVLQYAIENQPAGDRTAQHQQPVNEQFAFPVDCSTYDGSIAVPDASVEELFLRRDLYMSTTTKRTTARYGLSTDSRVRTTLRRSGCGRRREVMGLEPELNLCGNRTEQKTANIIASP